MSEPDLRAIMGEQLYDSIFDWTYNDTYDFTDASDEWEDDETLALDDWGCEWGDNWIKEEYPYFQKEASQLEQTLLSIPALQQPSITLYCDVPVHDLMDAPKACQEKIQFLICREDKIIAAIEAKLPDGLPTSYRKGIPTLCITPEQITENPSMLENWIELKLQGDLQSSHEYPARILTPQLHKDLQRERLFTNIYNEVLKKDICRPTLYGQECGIIRGYTADRNGRFAPSLFWPEQHKSKLTEILKWKGKAAMELKTGPKPFDERIRKLNRGLSSEGFYMASLITKLDKMPLKVYMRNDMDIFLKLKEQMNAFYSLDDSTTFGQAAYWIGQMLHSPKQRNCGLELMRFLATPILSYTKRGYK